MYPNILTVLHARMERNLQEKECAKKEYKKRNKTNQSNFCGNKDYKENLIASWERKSPRSPGLITNQHQRQPRV